MRIVSMFIIAALAGASIIGAPIAGAQAVHTGSTGGTVAGIAPAPVPPSARVPVRHEQRFLSGSLPVVVLEDGRVFADFGRGYEQVVRLCDGAASAAPPATALGVIQPAVTQPAAGQPLVQPAVTGARMSDLSCWSADYRGQISIAHP
ncbi:MAG: hypothetical protein JWM41_3239 [Gemmatimonadetes bacterium]|nr:hypothetical protein [Gemmatimonadota bacterium]